VAPTILTRFGIDLLGRLTGPQTLRLLLQPLAASGDERFRTLSSGGSKLVVGAADARKDNVDTVFRTALVVKF